MKTIHLLILSIWIIINLCSCLYELLVYSIKSDALLIKKPIKFNTWRNHAIVRFGMMYNL